MQELYNQIKEGNGQTILTVDLEEENKFCEDVMRFVETRVIK